MRVAEHDQAEAVAALVQPGEDRMRLMTALANNDATLRPLVQAAAKAGVRPVRIVQLTGLSKTTILKWTREAAS